MRHTRTARIARWLERTLVAAGAGCLIWVGAVSVYAAAYQLEQKAALEQLSTSHELEADRGFEAAAEAPGLGDTIGHLVIPRVGLSAMVMEGDDEKTLQVAVGHLPDTPLPWQEGNAALAGHRDTFFRPLRRIKVGDAIRLETPQGILHYRVTRQTIVEPHELWVLNPSTTEALTLITCYPFDFVGPAPRRLAVHAERVADASGRVEPHELSPSIQAPMPGHES